MMKLKLHIFLLLIIMNFVKLYSQSDLNKVVVDVNQSLKNGNTSLNNIDEGVYNLSFQLWLDSSTSIKQLYSYIKNPWLTQIWDLTVVEKAKWVKLEKEIIIETGSEDEQLYFYVPNLAESANENANFYIDDIVLKKIAVYTHISDTVNNIEIYPNPVTDYLKIKLIEDSKITIYNITGQVHLTLQANAGESIVSMSDYKSGFYIVEINTALSKFTQKIFKN